MKTYPALIALIFIIAFEGCITTAKYSLYSPNTLNVPMLKKQGDYTATCNLGIANGTLNTQAAFSPLNHLLVFGNYMNNLNALYHWDTTERHTHNAECGVGYYAIVNPANTDKYIINILAGYGHGYTFDTYTTDSFKWNQVAHNYSQLLYAHFDKYFIQSSFEISNAHSTSNFALRLTDIQMNTYATPDVGSTRSPLNGYKNINYITVEPAFTYRQFDRYLSWFFQYKMFFSGNTYYQYVNTRNGSAIAQTLFGISYGITITSDNIKNMLHPTKHSSTNTL